MTLVESLKKFLTKLGGDPTGLDDNATSAEVIDAITEAYTDKEGTYTEVTPIESSGTKIATITTNNTEHDIYAPKELPDVTASDKLKTLQVNADGEWTAGATIPDLSNVSNGAMVVVRGKKLFANADYYKAPFWMGASNAGKVLGVNSSGTDWTYYANPSSTWLILRSISGGGNQLQDNGVSLTYYDLLGGGDAKYEVGYHDNTFFIQDYVSPSAGYPYTTNIVKVDAWGSGIPTRKCVFLIDFLLWDFVNSTVIHRIFKAECEDIYDSTITSQPAKFTVIS